MKRIDTSSITDSVRMPFAAKSLSFLQDSYKEVVDAIVKGLVNYTNGTVLVLYGCQVTGTSPDYSISEGAIYYNDGSSDIGEIYLVDGGTVTTTGTQIPVWTKQTLNNAQYNSANVDPVTFTDNNPYYVHDVNKFVLVAGAAGGSGVTGYVCDYNGSGVIPFNTTPTGTIITFAASSAPAGYLICDGSPQSRTAFARLFSIIGTTYGAGDGSTTFNLPDLRGYFVRGWDDGRGVDSGRTFGSNQNDQFQDHEHNYNQDNSVSAGLGTFPIKLDSGSADTIYSNSVATSGAITGNVGSETRPKNVALLYCIKYY